MSAFRVDRSVDLKTVADCNGSAAPVRARDKQSFCWHLTPLGVTSRRTAASDILRFSNQEVHQTVLMGSGIRITKCLHNLVDCRQIFRQPLNDSPYTQLYDFRRCRAAKFQQFI